MSDDKDFEEISADAFMSKKNEEKELKEASGGFKFYTMMAILLFILIVCVICPIIISDFSKTAYAVPLMIVGLALPFLYFFIFGGMSLRSRNK